MMLCSVKESPMNMKKLLTFIVMACLLSSCATSYGVGNTKAASKAKRNSASRVQSQFNGVH